MKTKFKSKETVYCCRNSSYVFKSYKDINEAIDKVKILSIDEIRNGKTQYLVEINSDWACSMEENKLYKDKKKLISKLFKENKRFLYDLIRSAEESIKEAKYNISVSEANIKGYEKLLTFKK